MSNAKPPTTPVLTPDGANLHSRGHTGLYGAPDASGAHPGSQRILALDFANHTGFASRRNGVLEYGTEVFTPRQGAHPGMRWLIFSRWLETMIREDDPTLIVYEAPGRRQRSAQASMVAYGFSTRAEEAAFRHSVPCRAVAPAALKRWATGSGTADKAAMIHAAQSRAGVAVWDDDAADALLLLLFAEAGFPEAEPRRRRTAKSG